MAHGHVSALRPAGALVRRLLWNSDEGRPRALWRIVLTQGIFWGGLYGVVVPLTRGPIRALRAQGAGGGIAADLVNYGLVCATALLSLSLAARWVDRRAFADYGLHLSRAWWGNLALGAASAATLVGAITGVSLAMGWMELRAVLDLRGGGVPFVIALLGGVATQIFVGVWEELIFRAGLLKNLAEGLGGSGLDDRLITLLITAGPGLLFGLAHLGNPNATPVAVLGIALAGVLGGIVYTLTGELSFAIGLHIGHNVVEMNLLGLTSTSAPAAASLLRVETVGGALWTGGAAGKDAGLLMVLASLALLGLLLGWLGRAGALPPRTPLADYTPHRVARSEAL